VTAIPRSAPVAGSTALPGGFWHPHASEQARAIAEAGMILRVQVGSGVHGTAVAGQDDRDEMGLCLEPPEFVTGLARVPNGAGERGPAVRFEQYERHTAWDRPGGLANPSGAGDLDVVIYSARKWARLALAGNPTVLLVLFVPDHDVVFRNQAGAELTSRPELIAVHGYDTKYAMHALRLGLPGIELLTTGRITLPVPEPHRSYLRAIRRGEVPLAEVVDAVAAAETRIARLRDESSLPAEPDRRWVDEWLHRRHLDYWARLPGGD
jgi:uncharacterized protein